jgi:hypothetical protein
MTLAIPGLSGMGGKKSPDTNSKYLPKIKIDGFEIPYKTFKFTHQKSTVSYQPLFSNKSYTHTIVHRPDEFEIGVVFDNWMFQFDEIDTNSDTLSIAKAFISNPLGDAQTSAKPKADAKLFPDVWNYFYGKYMTDGIFNIAGFAGGGINTYKCVSISGSQYSVSGFEATLRFQYSCRSIFELTSVKKDKTSVDPLPTDALNKLFADAPPYELDVLQSALAKYENLINNINAIASSAITSVDALVDRVSAFVTATKSIETMVMKNAEKAKGLAVRIYNILISNEVAINQILKEKAGSAIRNPTTSRTKYQPASKMASPPVFQSPTEPTPTGQPSPVAKPNAIPSIPGQQTSAFTVERNMTIVQLKDFSFKKYGITAAMFQVLNPHIRGIIVSAGTIVRVG